jgi:micrococcal nuclease
MRLASTLALALVAVACSAPLVTRAPSTAAASPISPVSPRSSPSSPVSPVDTGLRPVGATEAARVVRVVDGDTLIIDRGFGNERLRYIGMDAPESVKPGSPVEFMGKEASAANVALVDGREIVLERDVSETDRYDRLLRYAWLRDGDAWLMVNLELVREGYAQVATYPPDVRWTDELRAAERSARDAGQGLWGPATPLP